MSEATIPADRDRHPVAFIVLSTFIVILALAFDVVYVWSMIGLPTSTTVDTIVPLISLGLHVALLLICIPLAVLSLVLSVRDGFSRETKFVSASCAFFVLSLVPGIFSVANL